MEIVLLHFSQIIVLDEAKKKTEKGNTELNTV